MSRHSDTISNEVAGYWGSIRHVSVASKDFYCCSISGITLWTHERYILPSRWAGTKRHIRRRSPMVELIFHNLKSSRDKCTHNMLLSPLGSRLVQLSKLRTKKKRNSGVFNWDVCFNLRAITGTHFYGALDVVSEMHPKDEKHGGTSIPFFF